MKKWPAAANEWLSAVWVANKQHQKTGVNTLGHRLTALASDEIRPLSMPRLLRMKGNIMGKYTVYLEHLSTNPPRYCIILPDLHLFLLYNPKRTPGLLNFRSWFWMGFLFPGGFHFGGGGILNKSLTKHHLFRSKCLIKIRNQNNSAPK